MAGLGPMNFTAFDPFLNDHDTSPTKTAMGNQCWGWHAMSRLSSSWLGQEPMWLAAEGFDDSDGSPDL